MNVQDKPEDGAAIEAERTKMYAKLRELNAYGFWTVQGEMEPPEPKVKELAHVWRWSDFAPFVEQASRIVPHELADRRGIVLHNPGLDMQRPSTTNTQYVAYSVYVPGEIFSAHIHSPAASRMLLKSDGKGYTTVEGEKAYLERGDLITTPSGTWHDHGNEGDEPMVWVDMLDIPVAAFFNAGKFGFNYTENGVQIPSQSATRSQMYSRRFYGTGGVRPRFAEARIGNDNGSPQLHWKYADVRAALNALRDESGDPYDGCIVDYVNVMDGGPIQKTQNFSMQLLRPGEHTLSHRHTSSSVYVVLEGSGSTIIEGEEHKWEENDIFCVPTFKWHEHVNASSTQDAVIYCVSDAPAVQKLGLYWEERKDRKGTITTHGATIPS
ncbi:cupin domain-containing protein [uncultured Tateyamaria sp.]|uniref:cupin domain-containing protein n=1 Tax=uncultured Tateyamaria sp. TaxID=455651 RepID=UPI00260F3A0A|nr:cupin domain-containing protein [uncultured Tateyamaria sp.]